MAACHELLIASCNPLRFSVTHTVEQNQSVEGKIQMDLWRCVACQIRNIPLLKTSVSTRRSYITVSFATLIKRRKSQFAGVQVTRQRLSSRLEAKPGAGPV